MELQTQRLLIRTLAAEDAPALAAIWSDADVTRFMDGPRDYEQTLQDMLSEVAESSAEPADTLYPVIDPENSASARVAEKAGMRFWKETVRPMGKRMHVYLKELG